MASFAAAVAFIIFNRPELTARTFSVIAAARPSTLLVVADGPRDGRIEDIELCRRAREVLRGVDWPCDLRLNCSAVNLGCRKRVSSGLDWVFSQVEEAIVLEDDCLPELPFFGYCSNLLEKYRNEPRVMHIGGDNFQSRHWQCLHSYYFSRYPHNWGWASWRRAWRWYDVEMGWWPQLRRSSWLAQVCPDAVEEAYWREIFDKVYDRQIDTWDYQWVLSCWLRDGVAVSPARNLVSNIGFGADATHTKGQSPFAEMPTAELGPIVHPPMIEIDRIADRYTFGRNFGVRGIRQDSLQRRIRRKLGDVWRNAVAPRR
jgi:hypothetical protein